MFQLFKDQLRANYEESLEETCVTPDKEYWVGMIKNLFFKLLIWVIGAWKTVQEQILDRHRRNFFTKPPLSEDERYKKVAIVTGGNRGIGFEVVKGLLNMDYKVIIACRDVAACERSLEEHLPADHVARCQILELDLSKVESVENFANWVNENHEGPVNVLINNAGTMFGARSETEDGYETQMATNYLGHYLLTHRIINRLRDSATANDKARIVNVTSCAHLAGRWINFDDFKLRSGYTPELAYANSKMAQVLHTLFLNSQLKSWGEGYENVIANCLHPGIVQTGLYQNVSWMTKLMGFMMKTPSQGADTILYAAISNDEKLLKGGNYLENSQICEPSGFAKSKINQVNLWKSTKKILKLDEQEEPEEPEPEQPEEDQNQE